MLNISLVFCHGFGLNSKYWANLIPFFQDDYSIINLDLGYFSSEPQKFIFSPTQIYLGIGHSLGWGKMQALNIPFIASVGLQSFQNFCGYDAKLNQIRGLELQKLQFFFQKNPKACLEHFYRRCGLPNFCQNKAYLNLERLQTDLDTIQSKIRALEQHPKLIIGTKKYPIVPPEIIRDNFDNQNKIDYILLPDGLHDLGFNHCETIAPIIREFFNAHLQNQK